MVCASRDDGIAALVSDSPTDKETALNGAAPYSMGGWVRGREGGTAKGSAKIEVNNGSVL